MRKIPLGSAVVRVVFVATMLAATSIGANSQASTWQELINEACAPSHYPLLPPCGREITLEEINNRLQYKLQMTKLEQEQMNTAMSVWKKALGLLYVTPTQKIWDINKSVAMNLSTPLIEERLSKAIDAQGNTFLAGAHGDPNLVRRNMLWYFMSEGLGKGGIEGWRSLEVEAIDPKLLFRIGQ